VIAAGGGFAYYQQQQAAKTAKEIPKGVQIGQADRGDIDQKITATGVIAAQTGAKVNIGSQIAGRIKSLNVDVGAKVAKDQVVAVIDSPDLEAQVEQQRHNVEVAQATLAQTESRLRQSQLTAGLTGDQTAAQIKEASYGVRAAQERLAQAQASSKLQPTQTSSDITRAQASLSTAKSQQKQTQATVALQLRQAQSDIDDARASLENSQSQLRRQRTLLVEGYVAKQQVENSEADYRRATARLTNMKAALDITKEKTEADLAAAQDKVNEAQAALEAAQAGRLTDQMREADMRNAQEAMKQAQATLQLRNTGKTQTTISKRAVEEARASLNQARASLRQAEASLRYQQAQLDKAVIKSPIAGTVLTVTTQQGETVASAFQVATLVTVADLNRLEIRAYVDEVDIGKVRLGLPAEVRVDAFGPDKIFKGRVTKISGSSTVKDNVVTYETTIALENQEGLLRPDMTADVTLLLGRRANVIKIPSEAVHREMKGALVYVLHRDKVGKQRVEKRSVSVGVDDGSQVEVVSGVKEGEEVVLAGLPRLGVEAVDAQRKTQKSDDQ
jgi:RND family efflux transporter MFP subunit